MPPLPPAPSCIKLQFKQTVSADLDVLNQVFVRYSGAAPTPTQISSYANACSSEWGIHMSPMQDVVTSLTEVIATDLTSPMSAVGQDFSVHTGTRVGLGLTGGVAAVIRQHIDRRYRGGHPRIYGKMGVVGDTTSEQSWDPAFVTTLTTHWTDFITAILATGLWPASGLLEQVNLSYFQGFVNFTFPSGRVRAIPQVRPAPVIDLVTGHSVNPRPASQRRRNLQGV